MNDRARQDLRGPVSTLHSEISEWDPAASSWRPPRFSSMTHFRPDGQISELEFQYEDGSSSRSSNLYDDAGLLIESRSRTNSGPETKSLYYYDASSRLVRVVRVDASGIPHDASLYTYDQAGRTTARVYLDIDRGTAMSFSLDSRSSYDSDETIWYDKSGQQLRRTTFTRDGQGRLLTAEDHVDDNFFGPDAFPDASPEQKQAVLAAFTNALGATRVMNKTSYTYDDQGRQIEQRTQLASLGENVITKQYNDHGDPIEETTVMTHREMNLDDAGNPQYANESSETSRVHYDYQYDAQGNWTDCQTAASANASSTLQPSAIERRQISYYLNS